MANLGINVTNVEQAVAREAIPANECGWFKMIITESEVVPSKKEPETGRRLNLKLKILEGKYAGFMAFEGLNIAISSPIAQEIAMKTLSAIGHSVNVLAIEDSAQLHNIPMWVKLKFVPAEGAYEAKNEISGYKHISATVNPAGAISATPSTGPAFIPPPLPASAAQTQAWAPPTTNQPWQAPAGAAVTPVQAAQPVAPVQVAQPVQQPVTSAVAIDPTTGLAIPPWGAAPV